MKKALLIIATAVVAFASCKKSEDSSSIEFAKAQYILQADAALEVSVNVSPAAETAVSIPLQFAGSAVLDKDYTVSSSTVEIAAGKKSGSITITPKDNFSDSNIEISLGVLPAGYIAGSNAKTTVAVVAKETLIYSFENTKTDVLDKNVIKVSISGLDSGSSWVASDNMELPFKLSGATDAVETVESAIIIKKGSNCGTLTVKAKDLEPGAENAIVTVSIDQDKAGSRFAAGANSSIELTIKGVLKISSLLGTWNFGGIFGSDPTLEDEDALESWFFLEDDDPELLPVYNEGFTLTFAEETDSEGNVTGYKIIPGGNGNFLEFYRESSISWTAPIEENLTNPGKIISDYCSDECNMWVTMYDENLEGNELLTWFSIQANRSFDNSNENIAEAAIAMRVSSNGDLIIHIKDYDQPPFGENWWSGFDPDMFAFASWFTKAE